MAHIKSSKKRIKTNEKRRQRNVAVKSRMKTHAKEAHDAIDAKDKDRIGKTLTTALSTIDRAASKGIVHPKAAARKKSTLQRRATAVQ